MKKLVSLILIISIGLFTACGKDTEQEQFKTSSIAQEGLQYNKPEGFEILTDSAEFTAPVECQAYQKNTDQQTWFAKTLFDSDCAETDSAFYFLIYSKLYVFYKETNEFSILCNNPVCSHDGGDCDAFIGNGVASWLEYYDGFLYTLILGGEPSETVQKQELKLYRISLDGSTKDEICTLATAVNVKNAWDNCFTVYNAAVHRGYLYYIYSYGSGNTEDTFYANNSNTLYRVALDGKSQPECICPMEYHRSDSGISIQAHGSYVYFIRRCELNEALGGYLYRLNTETNQLEYIDIGWISSYQIVNNKVIYSQHTVPKYFSYDLDTGSIALYETEKNDPFTLGYMVWDGTYYNILRFTKDMDKIVLYTDDMQMIYEYVRSDLDKSVNYLNEFISPDYNIYITPDCQKCYYMDKSKGLEETGGFTKTTLIY